MAIHQRQRGASRCGGTKDGGPSSVGCADTFPQGKAGTTDAEGATGSDDYREAEHDPLPAADPEKQAEIIRAETDNREGLPWLISMEEVEKGRVARSAVAVIDKLLKALDTGGYGEAEAYNFVEQVRGVLALARVLTETEDGE